MKIKKTSVVSKKLKWQGIANDYNSYYLRQEIWVSAFLRYPKLFKVSSPRLGAISQRNKIVYIADLSSWQVVFNEFRKRAMADYHFVEDLIDGAEQWGQKMNSWTKKFIFKADLKKISNAGLVKLLSEFMEKQSLVYAYGVALPLLDFQNFSFVESNLKDFLTKNVAKKNFGKYYSVFTQPVHNSFAQDQEEDLLLLMQGFYQLKTWRRDVLVQSLDQIKKNYPKFYKKLVQHTNKYNWVYYVYAGPAFTEQNFLDFIKDYLYKKVEPKKKLQEIKASKIKFKELKQQYLKELQPNKFEKSIIDLAGKMVWAKPRRKDLQSQSYYHVEKLSLEIGRRLSLSLDQVRSAPFLVLKNALINKKPIDINLVNAIYKFHVCIPNTNGKVDLLVGKSAVDFNRKTILEKVDKKLTKLKIIQGTSTYPGLVKGVVRIINEPADMNKMAYGNILVSKATTPSVVPAMKKAAAIVTDEGGLTCHASIVSRELKIPCVVGTKIATQVLKDGDLVEVDANRGVIKIIK